MSVLLIDDEPDIINLLGNHLDLHNIENEKNTSALAALKLMETKFYPVLLTDIRMPDMDGLTLTKTVKKLHPTCQIFFMTGYASLTNLVECFEYGAADYFVKPFDNIDFIINSLRQALARYARWKIDLSQVHKKKDAL